jgi:hypothetical protein
MCLCGMLAAEYATLPKPMKDEMRHFFDENERWLVAVLEEGRRSGALKFSGSSLDVARALVGSLEARCSPARTAKWRASKPSPTGCCRLYCRGNQPRFATFKSRSRDEPPVRRPTHFRAPAPIAWRHAGPHAVGQWASNA